MNANIEKTFQVEQPIDRVWELLSDPNQVVTCVPGAAITKRMDENNYKGVLSMKFGPVSAKFGGQITIEKLDVGNHEMVLNGKTLSTNGRGSADMVMNSKLAEKDGGTEVVYRMEVRLGGRLAQLGSGLINEVSNHLFDQLIANFKNKLAGVETNTGSESSSLSAASLLGSVIKSKIGGIFGGK